MRTGDRVEVIAVPADLPDGMGTKALFEACLGRVFPIAGFEGELVELQVGEVVGESSYMHSIWIERACLRPVESGKSASPYS
jgi:hypothetical protein